MHFERNDCDERFIEGLDTLNSSGGLFGGADPVIIPAKPAGASFFEKYGHNTTSSDGIYFDDGYGPEFEA